MIKNSKKLLGISFLSAVILVVLDQFTKYLAVAYLKGTSGISLIPGVLRLQYLENQSAAFSMDPLTLIQRFFPIAYFAENPESFLHAKMIFFAVLTIVVIVLLSLLLCIIPDDRRFLFLDITLLALISGAAGNLIDRLVQNYVVDFIYFSLIDFPIFNVADIYVTCSAIALVILVGFYYRDEDFEKIFPSKKNKR